MTERDHLLADLAVLRDIEARLDATPRPREAESVDWLAWCERVGNRSGINLVPLTEDPVGIRLGLVRRAAWALEQRLVEIADEERWGQAS